MGWLYDFFMGEGASEADRKREMERLNEENNRRFAEEKAARQRAQEKITITRAELEEMIRRTANDVAFDVYRKQETMKWDTRRDREDYTGKNWWETGR